MIGGDRRIPYELMNYGAAWKVEMAQAISVIRSNIKVVADDPLWGLNCQRYQPILTKCMPRLRRYAYCCCPMSGGGCRACVGRGLINEERYKKTVPEEMK